jgi:Fe2+ transport system protein FeoA
VAKLKASFNFSRTEENESSMTLDMVPKNGLARVVAVESDDNHSLRLMEMGLVPGAAIRMVKSAPLGDPIQVCVRNYDLALRRAEAKSIVVSLTEE